MKQQPGIRMVFVDLDGTLLQGVDTVSARTVRAFEKVRAKGITPVIATDGWPMRPILPAVPLVRMGI